MVFEKRFSVMFSLVLLLSMVLTACSPAGLPAVDRGKGTATQTSPAANQTTAMPTDLPTDSPQAAAVQVYTNDLFSFSLSYPTGYEVENSIYYTFVFLAPQGTEGHRERAFLYVEQAGDMTAEWLANKVKEGNANLGITITASTTTIDGQQAVILDNVPGQDLNRQVFIVNEGILYRFTFMPDDPQTTDEYQRKAYHQMEALYDVVINSLRFLPERREVPPVLSEFNMLYQIEQAVEARSEEDIVRLLGDEFLIIEWLDPGTIFWRWGRNDAAKSILNDLIPQDPDLVIVGMQNWPNVEGSPEAFSGYFPNESVIIVRVQGIGIRGSNDSYILLGRRNDGSLYWRGMLVTQGAFPQENFNR